jgi:hypothetical protein
MIVVDPTVLHVMLDTVARPLLKMIPMSGMAHGGVDVTLSKSIAPP